MIATLGLLGVLGAWAVFSLWNLRWSFLLLLVLYGTLFLRLEVPIGTTGTFISLVDLLFVIFVVAVVYAVWDESPIVLPSDRFLFGGIGLFFFVVLLLPSVHALFRGFSLSALTPGLRQFQFFLFFPITVALTTIDEISEDHLIAAMWVMVIAHFSYLILQVLTVYYPVLFTMPVYVDRFHRPSGLFWEPNRVGFHFAFVALLGTPYLIKGNNTERRAVLGLVVICLVGLLFSESRTSLVAYLVPVVAFLILTAGKREMRQFLPVAVAVPVVVAIETILGIGINILDRLRTILQVLTVGPASVMDARFGLWQTAIAQYQELGFWGGMITAREFGLLTDNYYLVLLIQAGPLGIFSILLLHLGIFRFSLQRYIQSTNPYHAGLCLAIVGFTIANIMYNAWGYHDIEILVWTSLGVVAAEDVI